MKDIEWYEIERDVPTPFGTTRTTIKMGQYLDQEVLFPGEQTRVMLMQVPIFIEKVTEISKWQRQCLVDLLELMSEEMRMKVETFLLTVRIEDANP